jgi:F-type H+-transporting ATPase subunit delta
VRDETVARNYAETLLEVAERHEGAEAFGDGIELVARLLHENPDFRTFLETPRVTSQDKKGVLRKVFTGVLPAALINFVLVTLDRRRQRLLRDIGNEYQTLLDLKMNRERVEVTVARPLDEPAVAQLQEKLTKLLGRRALPQVRVKPGILGGVVVRAGNTVYDGSLRRRLNGMRRALMMAALPEEGGA